MEEILNGIERLEGFSTRKEELDRKQTEINEKQNELKNLQNKRSITFNSITEPVLDEQIHTLETEIEGLNNSYREDRKKAESEFDSEKANLRESIKKQLSLYKRKNTIDQERKKGLEEVAKGRKEAEEEFNKRNGEMTEKIAQELNRKSIYQKILDDAKATHKKMVQEFSEGKTVNQADLRSILDEISANEKKIKDINLSISRMQQQFENDKQTRIAELNDYEARINNYKTVEDNMEEIDDLEHLLMSLNSFSFGNMNMLKNSPVIVSLRTRKEKEKEKGSPKIDNTQEDTLTKTEKNEPKSQTPAEQTPAEQMTTEEVQEPEPKEEETRVLSGTRLPIRSFWEIYNDTCTQHVGSIARNINKLAHMKVLPDKDEDMVQKALNVLLTVFKVPTKLVAKIPNAILRTDKKMEEMREKIDGLTPEEFQILVESPEKVNKMFGRQIKDNFDRDYLDPQFMKQYKVNNAYLDVVRERLGRERRAGIEYYREQSEIAHKKTDELDAIGRDNWTEEQQAEYNKNMANYQLTVEEGKRLQAELDTFDEGANKKSSKYRNISGWFLARFNPDNRNENAKMAELSKSRRIAGRDGNITEVNSLTGKMQRLLRENTDIRGGKKNYIDIGTYSIESPVETLDRGPQTKGRLLLTNIALVTSAVGLYSQVRDNIANREIVEAHNRHLEQVNEANREFKVAGEAKVHDSPDAPQTEESIARQTVEAGWNRGERGDLDATDWTFNQTYWQRDLNTHTEGGQVTAETNELLQEGDTLGALKNATEYYSRIQDANRADIQNYIPTHTQYDYTAFNFGDSADMAKVYDFFSNGVVPYETTVNGVMADLIPALREGVDINGVIFAGANALYQAQREGRKDKEKFKEELKTQKKPENRVLSGVNQAVAGAIEATEVKKDSKVKMIKSDGSQGKRKIKVMPNLSKKDDKDNSEERE